MHAPPSEQSFEVLCSSSSHSITSSIERSNPQHSESVFQDLVINLMGSVHLPNILQGITTGMRSTLMPLFSKELSADDAMIGLIAASAGVSRMLVNIPAGPFSSKFGCLAGMNIGMLVVAIGAVMTAVCWNVIGLCVSNFIVGGGMGLFVLARHVMLARIVEKHQRGRMMSIVGGGERWASVLGPLFGGVLVEMAGSRWCSMAMVPAALACVYVLSRSTPIHRLETDNKNGSADGVSQAAPTSLVEVAWQHRNIITRVGIYAMNIMQLRTCRRLMLPLAAMNVGCRPSIVGLMLSLSFAVDATLFFAGGMIMDTFGRKYSAIPTSVNLGVAFFILGHAQSTWSLSVASIAFGLADSLGAGLLLTLNADYAPKKAAPEFIGVFRTVQDSGQLIGPLVAGWLMQLTSFGTTCTVFGTIGLLNAMWAHLLLPDDPQATNVEEAT
jgi:MFS family permease